MLLTSDLLNTWISDFFPVFHSVRGISDIYKNKVLYNDQQRLESSFLEFPLLLKLKGDRMNNVSPYVIGGFNYRYDLAAKKDFDDEKPVYIQDKETGPLL